MDKVKNIPEVRFKDCGNSWFKDKLSELCDVRDGTHDSPTYLDSGYFFITSKNVKRGYINFDEIKFISKEDYDNINKRSKVDVGDILFGMIGTIGNIAIVRKEPYYAIKNVALIKDIGKLYNYFNYYYLQSPNIEKQLDNVLDGGTQKFISLKSIRRLDIIFPGYEEQTQIGNLFKNLDEKLELEKEKHEKLINFKKAMLEDMFSKEGKKVPKVRFDGFDDGWGFEAIKNLFYKKSAKSKVEHMIDNGKFLIMDMGSVSETGNNISYKRTNCTEDIIGEEGLVMPKDDIGGGKIIGRTTYVDQDNKYVLSDHVYLLYKLTENIIPLFVHYQINSSNFNKKIKRITTGSAQLGISWTNVGEEQIRTPSPEEQALIGNFFKNLDEKIELSEQKIAKIEKFKKAMLDKMFV